jgi:hypothetical protein
MEGYVTEFADGKLFAPPAVAPQVAKKAESGDEEHDPVDFPEAPASSVAATPAPAAPVVPAPVPEVAEAPASEPVPLAEATPSEEEPKPEAQS